MNAEVRLRAPPPLLDTVELAQPLLAAHRAVCQWASQSGIDVLDALELASLERLLLAINDPECARAAREVRLAISALAALEARPRSGFAGYSDAWNAQLALTGQGRETLVELCHLLGGILLVVDAEPFLLLLPQPDGTWVRMTNYSVEAFDGGSRAQPPDGLLWRAVRDVLAEVGVGTVDR